MFSFYINKFKCNLEKENIQEFVDEEYVYMMKQMLETQGDQMAFNTVIYELTH